MLKLSDALKVWMICNLACSECAPVPGGSSMMTLSLSWTAGPKVNTVPKPNIPDAGGAPVRYEPLSIKAWLLD